MLLWGIRLDLLSKLCVIVSEGRRQFIALRVIAVLSHRHWRHSSCRVHRALFLHTLIRRVLELAGRLLLQDLLVLLRQLHLLHPCLQLLLALHVLLLLCARRHVRVLALKLLCVLLVLAKHVDFLVDYCFHLVAADLLVQV